MNRLSAVATMWWVLAVLLVVGSVDGFFVSRAPFTVTTRTTLQMGWFDGIAKAFSNEDFKSQDQRVRASHILIKGEDIDQVLAKIQTLAREIQSTNPESLPSVFADMARRESMCPSSAQGGDLGLFGPGKMVAEFDEVLFPADQAARPPAGQLVGPVVTEFGCHIILVTQREENKDQVEEKLARIDPDAVQ